jgi:endonuclease YncB( thermonuclease family)/protein involved in polysaccharide export with SLBB domain
MIAIVLCLLAQIPDLPSYIRPDADIERREVTVEFIFDGDTFRGDDKIDYRLAGINAPEVAHPEHNKPTGEPGGEEATDALRALIAGRHVTALVDRAHPLDRYGRTVALIITDGQDVSVEMLRSGLAEPRYIDLSPMIDESAFLTAVSTRDSFLSRGAATSEDVTVAGHVLAPGDRIRILVGNQTQDFSINPDGEVLIRGLGVIRVAAKTAATATTDLDSAIRAKGITATPVTLFYLAPPAKIQRNVVVIGAVKKSGTFPATTLLGAISAGEGFTYEANPIEVRITSGETTTLINTARIMAGVDRDIVLDGGEVIVVPTLPRILVSGAVSKPNWVTALFLSEAISAAGGPIAEADLEHVEFRTGSETSVRINVQAIFSGKADDIRLTDRDRITIPIRPRAIVPLVQVYGPVQRPGTTEAFTIADAIREARPDTRADLTNVIIDRGLGDTEVVNARDITLGHDLDTDLKTGDRVLIPRRSETAIAPPQFVTVLGDVKSPGQVPPGTLTQILAAAGGPTNSSRTAAIRVRFPDSHAATYDLTRVTTGSQPDPNLPPNSTVYVESDEPRRQGMNDLRTFIGVISTVALLVLRLAP